MLRRAVPAAVLAAALALAAGCGGSDRSEDPAGPGAERGPGLPAPARPGPGPGARSPLALPRGVPTRAVGPAPAGSAEVIRAWTAAVRRADFDAAAALFAPGARVQNATPVLVLPGRGAARRWNEALPCGARVTELRGARGFAVVRFRLVDRRGSDCGAGTGGSARAALRIRDGRIAEWYRLPGAGRSSPPADTTQT